ncbi:MAG: DUF4397 domain-containing protein [Tissierellia bacterium]|nr:DUF4397 domain-containing protein [Tissierellia bacterium]
MFDINKYYNTYPYYGGYPAYNEPMGYNPFMLGSCFCKKSYLRVLNTFDTPLDVQVNEILIAENLDIGGFTKYIKLAPGSYQIIIYKSGEKNGILFESTIDIDYNLVYTAVVSSDSNELEDIYILMVPEEKEHHMTGNMSALRLANLSLDIPDVVITTSDGTTLFDNVKYGSVSCNVALPSGRYDLILKTPEGSKVLESKMDFAPKMHYTLFIVGRRANESLKIIVPEDGVNYLDLC